jgi:hypothetical protein
MYPISLRRSPISVGLLFSFFIALFFVCAEPASAQLEMQKSEYASVWLDSEEELFQEILNRIEKGDVHHCWELHVRAQEYKDFIWPEVPASNPRNNIPVDFAWGMHGQKSWNSLFTTLREYNGKNLKFSRVNYDKENFEYESFRVIPVRFIYARDESGKEHELQLLGSILVRDGKYKVFSFKTD